MDCRANCLGIALSTSIAAFLLSACEKSEISPEAYDSDRASVECPAGTTKLKQGSPQRSEWCEKPGLLWGGVQHGPRMWWYNAGGRQLSDYWVDGVRQGQVISWHRDGTTRMVSHIRDGVAAGTAVAWHKNGQKWWEKTYVDAREEGPWARWHDNGVLEEKGQYHGGNKIGLWQYWDRAGSLVKTEDLGTR